MKKNIFQILVFLFPNIKFAWAAVGRRRGGITHRIKPTHFDSLWFIKSPKFLLFPFVETKKIYASFNWRFLPLKWAAFWVVQDKVDTRKDNKKNNKTNCPTNSSRSLTTFFCDKKNETPKFFWNEFRFWKSEIVNEVVASLPPSLPPSFLTPPHPHHTLYALMWLIKRRLKFTVNS
jgi:hypothetical protein